MINKLEYNITNNNLQEIFWDIENKLEKNRECVEQLLKIDSKYCKMKINIEMLNDVINQLKNQEIEQQQQNIIIKYNGNPCITLNLCILAIITQNIINLDYQNNMKGINSFLIKFINDILKSHNNKPLIYNEENNTNNIDKIICIDDINQYNVYAQYNNEKVRFYSYNYIDFYSDSSEYEELERLIYKFVEDNKIPIEVYSELNLEEAVQMIKNGFGKKVVVFTNNEETKKYFKENILKEKLYINQNPFKENLKIISKEIFYN